MHEQSKMSSQASFASRLSSSLGSAAHTGSVAKKECQAVALLNNLHSFSLILLLCFLISSFWFCFGNCVQTKEFSMDCFHCHAIKI